MQSHAWADHLDISRAITVMGEHDLAQATAWMGAALHLLQGDLLVSALDPALIPEYQEVLSARRTVETRYPERVLKEWAILDSNQ